MNITTIYFYFFKFHNCQMSCFFLTVKHNSPVDFKAINNLTVRWHCTTMCINADMIIRKTIWIHEIWTMPCLCTFISLAVILHTTTTTCWVTFLEKRAELQLQLERKNKQESYIHEWNDSMGEGCKKKSIGRKTHFSSVHFIYNV